MQCASTFETTFVGGNDSYGNMFKLRTETTIDINAFTVHLYSGTHQVKVWARVGDYFSHRSSSEGWTLIQDVSVTSAGVGSETTLPPLVIPYTVTAGNITSFHIWSSDGMVYTNGFLNQGVDLPEIFLFEGLGCENEFECDYIGRIWNGKISYTYTASKLASSEACAPLSSSNYGDDVGVALAEDLMPMLADSVDGGIAGNEFDLMKAEGSHYDWMEVKGSYSMSM